MLTVEQARAKVIEVMTERKSRCALKTETINFAKDPSLALGRILAEQVCSDRNYPPFNRSIRDGFAVRASTWLNPARSCASSARAAQASRSTVL